VSGIVPFNSPRLQSGVSVTRGMRILGGITASIFAVVIPLLYFGLSVYTLQKSLRIETVYLAKNIERIIQSRPKLWEFEQERLFELVSKPVVSGYHDERTIRSAAGTVVVKNDFSVISPAITVSVVFFDSGNPVGSIETRCSIRKQVFVTVLLGMLSSTFGYLLFFVFRTYPVRRLENALADLQRANEDLESHREHLRLINQILRHDIINDLTAVKSGLRLYRDSGDEGLLNKITKKVDKSVELIREMKELESFILSNKDLEFHDVKNIIKKVIEGYGFIEFTIEGKSQILADESFGSVIDNIIRNAIDHGKTDRIDIKIDGDGRYCEVRIADRGVGISDDIKDKVFEEGFIYGETGHTGLGLHIVRKAMERYGGSVHIEDNTPTGAVFVLRLRKVR